MKRDLRFIFNYILFPGWYIAYIDREEEERAERAAKKVRMDRDDEERMRELIEAQAERLANIVHLQ